MEIKMQGALSHVTEIPEDTRPVLTVNVGVNPHIFMLGDLVLTNHKVDRKERVLGCKFILKKRHWVLWDKTITEATVYLHSGRLSSKDKLLENIELEPMSTPKVLMVIAEGAIREPVEKLPKKMKLMLEFRMVGPIRRIRYKLMDIRHGPKQSTPDKEGSQA